MMRFILLFCIGLVLFSAVFAQTAKTKYTVGSITKDAILADMDEYALNIAQKHVHPFSAITRKDFFARIERIKDSAAYFNIDELLVKWLQVNAMIQDGHTRIFYDYIVKDVFPFYCFWFEEGIFVRNVSGEYLACQHAQIIAVNDIPILEVAKRISTINPDTNATSVKASIQEYLFDPFVIHGLGISPARNMAVYTLVTPKGDTMKITPVAIDRRSAHLIRGFDTGDIIKPRGMFECTYVDSEKYLYVAYGSCNEDKKHSIHNLIEKAKEKIETRHPQKIILDLRDNGGGGYPLLFNRFIDYLAKSDLNKKGKIYVLVCRHTYSAAVLNAMYSKDHTNATIVGEPTGGEVGLYRGVEYFSLPATKLTVSNATTYVQNSELYGGVFIPDIIIPHHFSDFKNKVDATLDYAIKH